MPHPQAHRSELVPGELPLKRSAWLFGRSRIDGLIKSAGAPRRPWSRHGAQQAAV